ncbi:MAG TPA: class I SAM-dependent RNA methyltransferase [Spirochaetota bacterium]|nr:class I SAM-dependent RNA methyltransferase [Spirochaetota bacterium]
MSDYILSATCAFGIEAVLRKELHGMGFDPESTENGKITFRGSSTDIARCNLWLRSADRVFMSFPQFAAKGFDEYYENIRPLPWEEMMPEDAMAHVTVRTKGSLIASAPRAQSVAKKAILDGLRRRFKRDRFEETGPRYHVDITIQNDSVSVNLDSSGEGLHKRGYRTGRGEAPLRETLAAALVLLSGWTPDRMLADPMCGSGTIPIEAAMIGSRRAPGLGRKFAAEKWPFLSRKLWDIARSEAMELAEKGEFAVYASDIDRRVFSHARENARAAGVYERIVFERKDVAEFSSKHENGVIVTNPPYGERLGEKDEVAALYGTMGEVFGKLDSWSKYILCGNGYFERLYGRKSDRNRKLYNGQIKTYLYQYYGHERVKS